MNVSHLIKQKPYEKVIMTLHRHYTAFLPKVFLLLLLLIVPIVTYFLINGLFPSILQTTYTRTALVLLGSAYYLYIILLFFYQFMLFYLDMWVLTNDRLIDLEQKGLFHRVISEVDLFQIQDSTSEIKGFFASAFNFGDIYIQTAGKISRFIIFHAYDPDNVRQLILNLAAEDKKFHNKQ